MGGRALRDEIENCNPLECGITMRITQRWRERAENYRKFASVAMRTGFVCDFSESAAQAMFELETYGHGCVAADNGYAIGKSWLDVQLAMWHEDLRYPFPLVTREEIPAEFHAQLGFCEDKTRSTLGGRS